MDNPIAIGRFGSPYGVKGWIKVISFTDPIEAMFNYQPWFILRQGEKIILKKVKGKIHGKHLIVELQECQDRELVKTYTNLEIYINRSQLPPASEEEPYWVDLMGLLVVNLQQEQLGQVESLYNTGSNDVLVVKDEKGKERQIPYLKNVIINVDLVNKTLTVDWDSTF